MQVSGNLTKINQKSGRSARGPWTLYSLGIDSTGDGNVTWYGYGFDAPKVTEGSIVSFEAEDDNGRLKVKKDTLKLEKKTAPAAKKFAAGDSDKQDSIVRQNATSTAAVILNGMIANEVVKLPVQAKRYDFYLELLDELTNRLFLANRHALSAEEVAELVGGDAADAENEAEPADEDWDPV